LVAASLTIVTGGLALITPWWPDWIEFLSGWDPDHHNGSVERLIVIGLFALTAVFMVMTAIEWRRPKSRPTRSLSR
jgi:hypothetical protein